MKIIKYNKNLQNKLDLSIQDYRDYGQIEIDLIPIPDYKTESKFINLNKEENSYIHADISYNDDIKTENRVTLPESEKEIQKIKIKLEYEIKAFKGLFKGCECIKEIKIIKFRRKDILDMSEMFSDCINLINIFSELNNLILLNSLYQ